MGQNPTFSPQNQNSESTFVSSTLIVEETKVVSKLKFSVFLGHFWKFEFFILLCQNKMKNGIFVNNIS